MVLHYEALSLLYAQLVQLLCQCSCYICLVVVHFEDEALCLARVVKAELMLKFLLA